MKPMMYTPEEEAAMLAPMPGMLRRPVPPPPLPASPAPCRHRAARSPEARRANAEKTRVRSARARLKESAAMLTAAEAGGNPAAIANARRWVAQRTEGLARVLRELGLPAETD